MQRVDSLNLLKMQQYFGSLDGRDQAESGP
jgi:hypothetical protein